MYKNSRYLLGTSGRESPALFDSNLSFLIDFSAKLLTRDDPVRAAALPRAAPIQSA